MENSHLKVLKKGKGEYRSGMYPCKNCSTPEKLDHVYPFRIGYLISQPPSWGCAPEGMECWNDGILEKWEQA